MKLDYDKYGHCIKCGKYLMTTKVISGAVKKVWTADQDETVFLLDDGSKMRVTVCKNCKDIITPRDQKVIMKKVVKGWEEEIKEAGWEEKRKNNYIKRYSKRKIVCNTDNLSKEQAEQRFIEFQLKENKHGISN